MLGLGFNSSWDGSGFGIQDHISIVAMPVQHRVTALRGLSLCRIGIGPIKV